MVFRSVHFSLYAHNPDPTSPPRKRRHNSAKLDAGEHNEHFGMPATRKVASVR